jgi:L-methionine (R)-S-oxide reductase
MFEVEPVKVKDKTELYDFLGKQVENLLEGEQDIIANCANFTALLYHYLPDINWLGFYFFKEGQLVIGPFQGKPACVRIAMGKGVCGTAAAKRETLIVPNVNKFPGHITCDAESKSEIVLPMVKDDGLIGVLDIDSPIYDRFDYEDQAGIERLLALLISKTDI